MQKYYLKFTGPFSALKALGFGFFRLYADNRMQWEREDVKDLHVTRIWKQARRITIDELTNHEGHFFAQLLDRYKAGLPIPTQDIAGKAHFLYARNRDTGDVSLAPEEIDRLKAELKAAFLRDADAPEEAVIPRPAWEVCQLDARALETFILLHQRNWVELTPWA